MSDYDQSRLADYVDVPARIAEFRAKYPEGSLQPADLAQPYRIEQIGEQHYVVVVAAAYRKPDDPRPGVGMAYEQWPGRTPYTKNSELQNAETSAWGRAIVAALAADTKRIASSEDVRNRRADDEWEANNEAAQEATASDFAEEIQAAQMQATIDDIAVRCRRSLEAGRISQAQYTRLGRMAAARVQATGGRRDSTGDGDRGGAEPGAAGARLGPDGAGAGARGSGRDGEAGGVRPGVLPGVPVGDGVDRGTQARGGDRGASAATGR
jgi:hypothetical protein